MLKNYIKIAIRNLWQNPGYSFINIFGLTIGLTCCLIIFQFVAFEYSFDRFHENESSLYRVLMSGSRGGGEEIAGTFTPQAMGPALAEDIPEIRNFTRIAPDAPVVSNPSFPDRVFEEEGVFYVDAEFLEMFTFPIIAGNRQASLEPGSGMLSESAAQKYFGRENAVGQVLDVTGQVEQSFRVAGVFKDVPANSHLQFDLLLPFENLLQSEQYEDEPEGGWSYNNFLTFIQLHEEANRSVVDQKMTDVLMAYRGDILQERGFTQRLQTQPLKDVYLNSEVQSFAGLAGSYRTVYFFIIIGLLTLLIALFNYVNLATARALDRAREVGVRKVIGAQRNQLIAQFFLESGLTNLIAIIFAVVLAEIFQPVVNNLWGINFIESAGMNLWLPGSIVLIFLVSTVLAGLYPALVLSSFKPVLVLKSLAGSFTSQYRLRRGLVIIQFTAAIVLIGGTTVVYHQLNYMRSLDLGLDLEQVITIPGPRVVPEGTDLTSGQTTLLEELRRLPDVRQVATSWSLPGLGFNWNGASLWRAEDDESSAIRAVATYINTSFASLYDMELVAGRGFEESTAPFGSTSPSDILVNETTIHSLGFASPEEALDHPLNMGSTDNKVRIIGVFKDFNWSSAHTERENIIFGHTIAGGNISLRVSTGNLPETIAAIQTLYTDLFPGNVFSYSFMDETFGAQYQNDQRFATLFSLFAALAIVIACLGLFGLASFTAQQRKKEIGVRKVLGATILNIVGLLSKDFLKLVLAGFIIAVPVTWYIMNQWLADFAYRIEIGAGIFLLAGGAALIIALLTVSWQSVKAALMNPINSLRSE
ncbi:MAG: ABC transporter permease [Balneolaceae bacterium]